MYRRIIHSTTQTHSVHCRRRRRRLQLCAVAAGLYRILFLLCYKIQINIRRNSYINVDAVCIFRRRLYTMRIIYPSHMGRYYLCFIAWHSWCTLYLLHTVCIYSILHYIRYYMYDKMRRWKWWFTLRRQHSRTIIIIIP